MRSLLAGLLLVAVTAPPADAIPAFARKYGTTCTLCHDPIPRLTVFGEQFAARGFRLTDDDTLGVTSLGDPLLRLERAFPLAVRFDAYVRARGGASVGSDLATPTVMKLLSGGQISRNVTYYVYFLLSEGGHTGPIEDAWVMFRSPLGLPADVTIGQFQIADPLWKRELRITLEDYHILNRRVGAAVANLSYDRGVSLAFSPSGGTTVTAQVVNGNGIGEAQNGSFDSDTPKTGAAWLVQELGRFRLGGMVYHGAQRFRPVGSAASFRNRTTMAGPALLFSGGRFELGGQYIWREDSNADFSVAGAATTTRGAFIEGTWWPGGRGARTLVTALYNVIDSRSPGVSYETATMNLSWLHSRNLRLALEGSYDLLSREGRVAAGVVTAF